METQNINSERCFQRGSEESHFVEEALECTPHLGQHLVLLTPATRLFSLSPDASICYRASQVEEGSALLSSLQGVWDHSLSAGTQDTISDTSLPFPGLCMNVSGKTCAHQVPSKDPITCSIANTVGQQVLWSGSPSQGLIRGIAAVWHVNFLSLAFLCRWRRPVCA